jgi:uncharacterized protein (TIGR02145 family)
MQIKNNKSGFFLVILIAFLAIHFTACNEKVTDPVVPETDSIIDIDGNIYKTVKIGNQWWMAENLKVKRYSNGDSIAFVANNNPDSVWANLNAGAYCYFKEKFGVLYNFYTISDPRGIAPSGWHVPTDEEWKEMEMQLGMSQEDANKINWRGTVEGNKLKKFGGETTEWLDSYDKYAIYGTNESGFAAIGSACRMFNGLWGDQTHNAFWWSSSLNGSEAWYRGLDYNKANVYRYYGPKTYGFSIRCVKD